MFYGTIELISIKIANLRTFAFELYTNKMYIEVVINLLTFYT